VVLPPEGHPLAERAGAEPVGCDACGAVLMDGRARGCSACEYDVCPACFLAGRAGTSAPPQGDGDGDEAEEGGPSAPPDGGGAAGAAER
jgi:hypothetical protein